MPSSRRMAIACPRPLRAVGGDPDVEGLAGAHRGVQRAHRLLQRRVRVEPVAVEDVHVVDAHPGQRLVQTGQQVLAGAAALPVRARPHVVAGLGRQDQLIAVRPEVLGEDRAEVGLRAAVGRPVVVGQVEVRDAAVEGAPQDGPLPLEGHVVAEVVPQPQRDGGQVQATSAAAAVPAAVATETVVALGIGEVGHGTILRDAAPLCRIGWGRIGWGRIGWGRIGWGRIGWGGRPHVLRRRARTTAGRACQACRKRRGVVPTSRVKCRCRCAWS